LEFLDRLEEADAELLMLNGRLESVCREDAHNAVVSLFMLVGEETRDVAFAESMGLLRDRKSVV
jgi:hypothetical protein